MAVSSARLRLITAILGGFNLVAVIFVFAAPFWRTTAMQATINAFNNVWGYEGLWMECMSFYRQQTQCYQIGQMSTRQASSKTWVSNSYYKYGIYAHLDAYRAFMAIALVTSAIAFCLSLAGMKCTRAFREDSKTKRWINLGAGICHIIAGVLTGIAVSWYAAEVVREYWSPYYQTTRVKYTLGSCLFIGWFSMALSLGLGCILTCCTCFNRPVDKNSYEWKHPVTEVEISSQPVEAMMMTPSNDDDEWDDDSSRYSHSRTHKSHKSHRSHRSHKSHRSHGSHHNDKRSEWVDDYHPDPHPNEYDENGHVDGFV
ncbi:claudin-8-like [Styela clava]